MAIAGLPLPGDRLVEEKAHEDGTTEVIQEYNFAPDIAYSLFCHWKNLDDSSKRDEGDS